MKLIRKLLALLIVGVYFILTIGFLVFPLVAAFLASEDTNPLVVATLVWLYFACFLMSLSVHYSVSTLVDKVSDGIKSLDDDASAELWKHIDKLKKGENNVSQ